MRSALFFLLKESLTAALAIAFAIAVFQFLPKTPLTQPPAELKLAAGLYFPNPASQPIESNLALEQNLKNGELVVFGSSELTVKGENSIQNFYPKACGKRVLSIGHAGFQSLPILITLAEARTSLSQKSNIAIILSPVWFTERGTSSDAFLHMIPPYAMSILLQQTDLPETVRTALAREVRIHRDEFTGLYPDWLFVSFPTLARASTNRSTDLSAVHIQAESATPDKDFDWAKTEERLKEVQLKERDGNPLGTTMEYYNKIKNSHPPLDPGKLDPWQNEKQDLYALSEFLRSKGVRAHFILQPIHRRVYKIPASYDTLFAEIEGHLKGDGHSFQNFFTEPYDLSLLKDSSHFNDYTLVRLQHERCVQ